LLDPGLTGVHRAFAALRGECKVRTVEPFTYKLCFFREAVQIDENAGKTDDGQVSTWSLGRWAGWDFSTDPPMARFEGGAVCPGGQSRKVSVTFRCSSKAKLKSVTETESCVYAAEMLHPGACDDSRAPEAGSEEKRLEGWAKVQEVRKELLELVDREMESWRSEKLALEEKLATAKGAEPSGGAASEPKPDDGVGAGKTGEQPQISEYAKWMEGGSAAASAAGSGDAADASTSTPAPEATDTPGEVAAASAEGSAAAPEAEEESPERRAHREAEALWTEASAAARDTKHKVWGLEARLHSGLAGGWLALAGLADECLEKADGKFTYRVCFFRHAYQDTDVEKGIYLGRWIGWDFSGGEVLRARFDRGASCGNGVRRSLTVTFACGERAVIETVVEKLACIYEAQVLHPGGCNAMDKPEKRHLPALLPKDEL